ncbi:hypothetical protein F66182_8877 [Fusarium sp. NRRL 66182]|nr:hypothetical protein F66182_8877 [Fusarium sp. NRRL 66182]
MKAIIPVVLAFLGTAFAVPVQQQDAESNKRSEAESPDILYNNQAGWAKRSEAESPDILYNNQAGWAKRSEAESPDILYNNQAGWAKRSED